MSCGPGRLGDRLVPDGPWARVCEAHDEAYARGGTRADRRRADLRMLAGMVQTIAEHDHRAPTALLLLAWAAAYYVAVRAFGWIRWRRR